MVRTLAWGIPIIHHDMTPLCLFGFGPYSLNHHTPTAPQNKRMVNNYGVWLRYNSRSGTHNMYKEYRDTTLCGAVSQMYSEMAGRHRARYASIQVIRTATVNDKDCRRTCTTQFHGDGIKFPLAHRIPRASSRKFKRTFSARRPCTFSG